MRVIFMGTPEFSVPVLDALVEAGHDVACVYCQPPRPAGRGKKDRPSPVQLRAEELGLPVRHPASLKTPEAQAEFADLDADIAVVVAYGLILPQAVLDAPNHGCLNIHASLLPRWRGAAPIHRAIMAGDAQTGVCIMQMEAGLDTGPVLLSETTPIGLARIDWSRPAVEVDRLIRGLSPFPGAWFEHDGVRIKVLQSRLDDGDGRTGEVLDESLRVACGQGAVKLTQLQRAGKAAQDADTFQRGAQIAPGTMLSGG